MDGTYMQVGPVALIAALLFLCGEGFKKMGLGRHLIPAALGIAGIFLAAGLALCDGTAPLQAFTVALPTGLMGAAACVYAHQLCVQFSRRDKAQAPFRGFYFDKRGEGL